MADFSALIQRIKDAVYENGVQAITGQILQDCLKDVVNTVNVAKQDGIYRVTVTVDNNTGVPSATARMDDDTYTLEFSFHNLKGQKGDKGDKGDTPVLTADSDGVIYSDGVMLTRVIKDTTDALTTRADSDHARAESDHARAETDHTDITRARLDAETAAGEANYASLRANTAADNADAAREAIQSDLAQKQDVIPDLQQIRAGATDTVKYTSQSLTDAQKGQARTNIGAASDSEVSQLRSDVTDLDAYLDHSPVSIESDCSYTNWSGTGKIEKTTGTDTYLTASCQAGDMFFFEVINKGVAQITIWNIVDAEDNLVRRGGTYLNASNGDKGFIVIPTNGVKLIVRAPSGDLSSIYLCRGEKIADSVKDNAKEIKTVAEKVGIIEPEIELIEGKYIYKTGAVNNVAGGFLTKPFSALKGDKIKINCVNWYSSGAAVGCVLAKCTGQDASGTPTGITPLVLPTSANRENYEYTLTENASLTVSFKMYGSSGQSTFAEPYGIVIERPVSSGSGEYVPIQQGVGNSGKLLGVGADGNVTLVSGKVTIDNSEKYVLYQKIKNGDFSDGLDNWVAAPATNVSVEDGMLKINTAASVQCRQEFASIASGHKLYLVYYAKRGSSAANPQVSLGNLSAAFTYNYKDTITESLAMYSHLATLTSSVDRITFSRDGSGSIYYADNIRLYDLTEIFGAGEEPTLEECDALFNGTEEVPVKDYVDEKIQNITDIKEEQLSEAVQIKLNAGGGGGAESKWLGAKIGCLGDSITAIDNNLKKYYRYMEDFYTLSGVSVAAISGATISSYSNPFYNRVTDLAADCDLVLVLGGINDFNHGVSIGEICTVDGSGAKTATSDTSTFFGSLHTMVQNLITRFPTKPIVLMTPLHSGGYNSGGTSYPSDLNKNSANKYLSDYVQAIKDIGSWYSIPVLDLYSVAGFNPTVADFATEYFSSSADLLHPNTKGHALIANRIEGFLNSIG